jgi:membrane associated rhomboid family serine protease
MMERRVTFGLSQTLTPMVRNLLIINAAFYAIQLFFAHPGSNSIFMRWLALWPPMVLHDFAIWQLLTYQFLHGSFFHILFNLFALWMFGCEVERVLGARKFLLFYLVSGAGAGLFHLLFNAHAMVPVIGASGAIYAVLVAFALLFPNRVITLLLFFVLPIEIKAKYLVAIFLAISLFSGMESSLFGASDGVAHLAHLGGALTGFILLRGGPILNDAVFEFRKRMQWRRMAAQNRLQARKTARSAEIDRLLDRINEIGYDALSKEEKETLLKNSKHTKEE